MRSVEYDRDADALYVRVAEYSGDVTTKKLSPGVFADYDEDGMIVGVEVLRAQIHNRRLHAVKKGRDWLVSWEDIVTYLESRHVPKHEAYAAAGGGR